MLQTMTRPLFAWQYHFWLLCLFLTHVLVIIDSTNVIVCPVNTNALAIKTTCFVFPTSGFSNVSQVCLHFSVMLTFEKVEVLASTFLCLTHSSNYFSIFIFINIHVSILLPHCFKIEDNYLWSWSGSINIKTGIFLGVCKSCLHYWWG